MIVKAGDLFALGFDPCIAIQCTWLTVDKTDDRTSEGSVKFRRNNILCPGAHEEELVERYARVYFIWLLSAQRNS